MFPGLFLIGWLFSVCSKLEASPGCVEGMRYLGNSLHTELKPTLNRLSVLDPEDRGPSGEICPAGSLELLLFTEDLFNVV